MDFLMIIGIGPLQELIATARRSRALWVGSCLFSEFSKTAARTFVDVNANDPGRLIFPAVKELNDLEEGSGFNVVNKIVAVVDEPELTGEAIRQAIQARL